MRQAAFLIAASLALLPGVAAAKCAGPRPFFAPESGATLPARAAIYLFQPGERGGAPVVTVQVGDAAQQVRLTEVGRAEAFFAYRLEVSAAPGQRIRLRLKRDRYQAAVEATYTAGAAAPSALGPVQVRRTEEERSGWTCSYQSTRNLLLTGEAVAYRLEWAASAEAYRRGQRQRMVLPPRMERFFTDRPGDEGPRLELGHVNCFGVTFPWSDAPVYAGVAALHADGGESPAPAEPLPLQPPAPGRPAKSGGP